jgi:hypothetical protein
VSETWRRRILYVAGGWNVLGGVSALADPARHFVQLYGAALSLDDPRQAFFFRTTWVNVIPWGLGYILAARRPAARGPVLLAGGRRASSSTSARAWRSSAAGGAPPCSWSRAYWT